MQVGQDRKGSGREDKGKKIRNKIKRSGTGQERISCKEDKEMKTKS